MDEHKIIGINGRFTIDGHEVPWPEHVSYRPDTHETTLTYTGIPHWITLASGGGGTTKAETHGSGGGGGGWSGEWGVIPDPT